MLPSASPEQTTLGKPMQNHILVCKLSSSAGLSPQGSDLSYRVLSQVYGMLGEILFFPPSHSHSHLTTAYSNSCTISAA